MRILIRRTACLRYGFLISILWLPILVFGQGYQPDFFDFSQHNFQESPVGLSGKWDFYFNQLYSPVELKTRLPKESIVVPGTWNRDLDYPMLGCATYSCRVLLPSNQEDLLLLIPAISSAAKVWLNDRLMSSIGKVDSSTTHFKAELTAIHLSIPPKMDTVHIVIQVANYAYFGAGILSVPTIGISDQLVKSESSKHGVEIFFAGSLIAMFIYHIVLFFLYNDRKPNLWLSLVCLGVAIRGMVINGGSYFLPNLFPEVSFEIWKKLEFGSVYAMTAIFPLFIYHLFESGKGKKVIIRIFSVASLVLIVSVILLPQYIYGKLLDICHFFLLLAFLYALITISKAWRSGNSDAKIIFFGVFASFPLIVLEILKNTMLFHFTIHLKYLVEMGVLIFLLFQAFTLARHYAKSFKSITQLNLELETTVAERTQELTESNQIRERLLSVISHDVKSPLNSLQGLISVYNNNVLSREDLDKYLKKIEGNLINTTGLVDNILYWTANQRKGNEVCIEPVALDLLVKDNINHLQAIANNKCIALNHSIPAKFMINTDRGILNFVLRNLISNAVKFSHSNSKIHITFHELEGAVAIGVVDQGIGMTDDQQEAFRSLNGMKSTRGTNTETGTGLGLGLCKEFLGKIGGRLEVYSRLNKGTTFTICLPVRKLSPVFV